MPDRKNAFAGKKGKRAEHVPGVAGSPSGWSLAQEDVGAEYKA